VVELTYVERGGTNTASVQVHAVLESLTRHLPDLRLALVNGHASAQEEAATLLGNNVPDAVPSLLGLLPAIQPLFRDQLCSTNYSPAAVSCLLSGAKDGSKGMHDQDKARSLWVSDTPSDVLGACPAHIAVVTPGRLVYHLRRLGNQWLRHLRFLVRTCCLSPYTSASCTRQSVNPYKWPTVSCSVKPAREAQ
jgi:hypothetical protein